MNSSNRSNSGIGQQSLVKRILFYVILIVFILVIIYIIYYAWYQTQLTNENEPILIQDILDSNVQRGGTTLYPSTEGLTQSMSTWIYVKNWETNFGKFKNILWKGKQSSDETARHSPSIWLYPLTNNLKVITSVDTTEAVESCDINNIPLMKWVHVCYVLNNRTVDVYINGKLERSCALKGVPKLQEDTIYFNYGKDAPGYDGKIGKTQYFKRALQPNEVANIYNMGPIGSMQYDIKFFDEGYLVNFKSATQFS